MKFMVSAILIALATAPAYAVDPPPIFQDGFEHGLENWHQHKGEGRNQGTIDIVHSNCFEGSSCVRLESSNQWHYVYIGRAFKVPKKGTVRIEGRVRADNVVPGTENYHRGKFIAVVIQDKKEVQWAENDFQGTFVQWVPRSVTVPDMDDSLTVDVRIGIQNAKGTVYVDDVRVYFMKAL